MSTALPINLNDAAWMFFALALVIATRRGPLRVPLRRRSPLRRRLSRLELRVEELEERSGPPPREAWKHYGREPFDCRTCPGYKLGDWCICQNKTYDDTTNPPNVAVCPYCWPDTMPPKQ